MTVGIFISYSHKDDAHRVRLMKHLAPLLREKDVVSWFDGDIEPGKGITPEIRKALRQTDIFVALGSSDYLDSDYCYRKEYRPMLRKAKQGRPRVVVALVGICDWLNTEMARSKMLPNDAKSVEEHGRRNRAYLEIAQGIRKIVRAVRQEKGKAQAAADRLVADKTKAKATTAKRPAPKKAAGPGTPTRKAAGPSAAVASKTPKSTPSSSTVIAKTVAGAKTRRTRSVAAPVPSSDRGQPF